jgi:hypothetical protein
VPRRFGSTTIEVIFAALDCRTSACNLMPMGSPESRSILIARFFSVSVVHVQQLSASSSIQTSTAMPQIPSPSGPFGIGRIGLHWIDTSRTDDYDRSRQRELMVYFWYPAAKSADPRGQYLPGAAQMDALPEIHKLMSREFGSAWAGIVSGEISSHAIDHAPICPQPYAVSGCHFLSRARQHRIPIHSADRRSGESWIRRSYAGCHVYGSTSSKLCTPAVKVPKSDWIVTPAAFAAVVDARTRGSISLDACTVWGR